MSAPDNEQIQAYLFRLWESACADHPIRPSCTVADGRFVLTLARSADGERFIRSDRQVRIGDVSIRRYGNGCLEE